MYVSTPAKSLNINDTKEIVHLAQQKNGAHSITGFLCCNSKYFIQCLEGDRDSIERLFEIISEDTRHTNIVMLDHHACDHRVFSNWSMGVVLEMDKHHDILHRYTNKNLFDPYKMSSDECLNLLVDFSQLKQ